MSLLDEINTACTVEEIAAGNYHVIAAKVNEARVGLKVPFSRLISERGILDSYSGGPVAADALLAKLEAYASGGHPLSRLVGRALKFLADPAGLDLGSLATRAMVDQLALSSAISTDEATKLKALAEKDPQKVTWDECQRALGA